MSVGNASTDAFSVTLRALSLNAKTYMRIIATLINLIILIILLQTFAPSAAAKLVTLFTTIIDLLQRIIEQVPVQPPPT